MNCEKEAIQLMHKHLDGDLTHDEQAALHKHLEQCEDCQQHFHELKRTVALIQGQNTAEVKAPAGFISGVMDNLPKEQKRRKYLRLFRAHPVLTAAAIFFILMFGGVFSEWNKDQELSVSKQEDLIIQDETVIVPEDATVKDDLVVKNGDLKIKGQVEGDVTLINGKLLDADDNLGNSQELMASTDEINGEFKEIDQVFGWIWYHLHQIAENVMSIGRPSD